MKQVFLVSKNKAGFSQRTQETFVSKITFYL